MGRRALAFLRSHICPSSGSTACCPVAAGARTFWESNKADVIRLAGLPVFWLLCVVLGISVSVGFVAGALWVICAPLLQRNCDFLTWAVTEKRDRFVGKVAMVTGAASGLGVSLCRMLALRGVKGIVMADADEKRLQGAVVQIIRECKAQGVNRTEDDFLLIPLDGSKGLRPYNGKPEAEADTAWQHAVKNALQWRGGVDFLFHNAGQLALGCFPSTETCAKVLDANVLSAIRLTNLVLPHMQARDSGNIIFTNSAAAYMFLGGMNAFSTSKAALLSYASILRQDLRGTGSFGVHVTSVHLGCLKTRLSENICDPLVDPALAAKDSRLSKCGLEVDATVGLLLRAVSRNLEESWIAEPKYLLAMYVAYYLPQFVRFLQPFLAAKQCTAVTEVHERIISELTAKS